MKNYLVLLGGELHITPYVEETVRKTKYAGIVAGDSGLMWAKKLGIVPTQMMGDYDSVDQDVLTFFEEKKVKNTVYPTRKDLTDSELALLAVLDEAEAGDRVLILGGLGGRLDHTLSNCFLLYRALEKGVEAILFDGYNEVRMIKGPSVSFWDPVPDLKYFSLIPFASEVKNVTLKGFLFELEGGVMKVGYTLGNSNEIVQKGAKLSVEEGMLLVVRAKNRNDLYE